MFVTESRTEIPDCPVCGTPATRNFSFNVRASMPEHFNYSVGSYVSNERQLRDAVKVAGEQASYKAGMDTHFEYLSAADMADPSAHGVTEEGLDDTRRATYVAD